MPFLRSLPLIVALSCVPSPSFAQGSPPPASPSRPGSISVDEATALTQGWALLAQGLLADASKRAAEVLASYPRSAGAIALAVETAIAVSGSRGGLDRYEHWLGSRAQEEPLLVRRIAAALLREIVAEDPADAARLEALRALAADGDAAAAAELSKGAETGSAGDARALAEIGDEGAVKALIARLKSGGANATSTIGALGRSGSRLAVAPLTALLQDRAPEIRGAAVEALGILGSQYEVAESLEPLLEDPSGYVRIRAAAALFRLGDTSGEPLLRDLYASEAQKSHLIAAQAMSSRPDGLWMDHVRRLTSASEPEVRIGAATLIAPHDPELAQRVIEREMADSNPAVREMATDALTEVVATDLRRLRQLLRLPDRLSRARAAGRILALVR